MAQIQKLIQENQKLKYQLEKFKGSNGLLPYVDDSLFKGGYRVVKTIDDRNNIDCCHRKLGMKVLVIGEDLSFKEYILKSKQCSENIWEEIDITVDENEVFLIEDYSDLGEDLSTQRDLNLILKQILQNLQTQIDNIELTDEKVQITENTGFAQVGENQKIFNKNVSIYKNNNDLKNQEQDSRLDLIEQENQNQNILISELENDIINLEGINYIWSPTNRTLTLYDNNGNQLSQVSLISLDNEGTDLRYNASTLSLELYNADNELLDSIPISSFIGSVGTQLQLNSNQLQLKDSQGNILSTVSFTISNIQGLQTALDAKLNKPTITGNTTSYPFVVGEDGNGNSARLPAGDLGKNFFNSDLSNTTARNHTMNAGITVNTLGNPHTLSGLPNKNTDIANFRKVRVQNASSLDAVVDSKNMLLDMPSYLTEQERTNWKTAMNGGWTTNTMSIGFISPITVKRENFNTFFSLKGANLNLNPTSFKVEIMDETGVNVLAEVPNSQVTLYTNGFDLYFYYNVFSLGLGNFKIRLWNGVATYTSGLYFSIVESVEYIDLSANVFDFITFKGVVNDNSSKSNTSVSYKADADVKPLANNGDLPLLSALSNQIATMQDNFYLEFNFTVSGGDFGNNNINRVGICNSSTNSLSNDIIAGLVQQTSTNHIDINGGGTVISNNNTATKMVIIKQNNIISTYLVNSSNTTFKSSVISTFINNNPVKIKGLFSNTSNAFTLVSFSIVKAYKF